MAGSFAPLLSFCFLSVYRVEEVIVFLQTRLVYFFVSWKFDTLTKTSAAFRFVFHFCQVSSNCRDKARGGPPIGEVSTRSGLSNEPGDPGEGIVPFHSD